MDDNAYQQLITALTNQTDDMDSKANLSDLVLQNMAEADPKLKAIATYLLKQQPEASNDDDDTEDDGLEDQALSAATSSQRHRAVNRLKQITTAMYTELEDLRERNDALAAALGACYLCWGEDPTCEACRGQGQPGRRTPDRALFGQYVAPVIKRARMKHASNSVRKDGSQNDQLN